MRYRLRNNGEVAHFWANEVQEMGAASNMFFERGTIYSYGHHFPIAKHYDNDLILFTNRDYSVSTSKHISYTRQAIPYEKTIIYCYDPENPSNKDNLTTAIREIEYNLKKAIKARSRKEYYIREAESAYNGLMLLKETFNIKGWKIPKYDFSIPENVMDTIKERQRKEEAKRKRQEAKKRKQDKLNKAVFLEDVRQWKNGEIRSSYGIRHSRFAYQDQEDYCRINGDIIETTQNANAPLKEVKAALKRIKQGKSIKGLKLGHYTVTSYVDGVLKIGCHTFRQSEIDWLMKELNI